jgi:hypothetical protein
MQNVQKGATLLRATISVPTSRNRLQHVEQELQQHSRTESCSSMQNTGRAWVLTSTLRGEDGDVGRVVPPTMRVSARL